MAQTLAIFGGTFDPIHLGHLRSVLEVAEELSLAKVLFMPAATPPHRKSVATALEHRLEMVSRAVSDQPLFGVTDIEARRGGLSRTVDTLTQLRADNPGAELYFILGADSFFTIHAWYEPLRLFELADFLIMDRPGVEGPDLGRYLAERVDERFAPAEGGWVRLAGGHGARRVHTTLLEISSTDIKRRVAAGRSIAYLVHPRVESYIKDMNLYRQAEG